MAMTNEQFNALVSKLEDQAQHNPVGYKLRLFSLALLGYGYLALMVSLILVLFLAALGSLVFLKGWAIKLIIPIGAFLWIVLRAIWVTLSPPQGRRVTRKDAPALFGLIDSLRKKLKAPQFHEVLITDDFNAGVVQVPRLGMFGWHRNYLLIGLPLMKTLSVSQLTAVLAHEFGHLAGGHAAVSNWIYRLRMSWARLLGVLEQQKSAGTFLFRRFFNWYAPYFNAYSFPLARANEYEADAAAARLVSPKASAEALTGVSVIGSYLGEHFWPKIHRQADEAPQPSFAPFARMGDGLSQELDETSVKRWVERAMSEKTTASDTHPSLADRLKAIGETPRIAPPAAGKAADSLLGEALSQITAEFDDRWKQAVGPSWEERHREVQEGRRRLAELDELEKTKGQLPLNEALERARLNESYGAGADAALAQFRALYERAPDDVLPMFFLGLRLLWRDDGEGVNLVERAMEKDDDAIVPGSEALRDYYWRKGEQQLAYDWHGRMVERQQLLNAAQQERDNIWTTDKFDAHGLSEEAVADLRRQLQTIPGLRKAYFARKRVKHMTHSPCYVLGYIVTPWWRWQNKTRIAEIQRQILETVRFPGETIVMNLDGDNSRFRKKFRWKRGTRLF